MSLFGKAYVINLDRSQDRWNTISKRLNKVGLQYERYSAVDGSKLTNKQLEKYVHPICRNYICNKSLIGCAMSHYLLWKKAVQENKKWIFILEDDAIPVDDIRYKLNELEILIKQNPIKFRNCAIDFFCILNCYQNNNNYNINSGKIQQNPVLEIFRKIVPNWVSGRNETKQIIKNKHLEIHQGNYQLSNAAYIIDYECAKNMVELIDKYGIKYHIDSQMAHNKGINQYSIYKPLFYTSGQETTIGHNYSFPNLPSKIGQLYSQYVGWTLNVPITKFINISIMIYILLFVLIWIFKPLLLTKILKYILLLETILLLNNYVQ